MRLVLVLTFAVVACSKQPEAPPKRVTLRQMTGATYELIPGSGQSPYCLVYTVSPKGLIRQLTMSADNLSFECPAGQPIGRHPFRVALNEPSVKVLVLFTSQQVSATSVSQQLLDSQRAASLTAMDLRLPGQATLEVLDFVATPEVPAEEGTLIEIDSKTAAAELDAGTK